MDTPTPPEPTPTPPPEPQTVKLGDAYDECLLGATLSGNYAYSLKRLTEFEMCNRRISEEKAQEALAHEMVEVVREHGHLAPIFIDDTLFQDDTPKIVTPGFQRPRGRTGG